jgi:hypothetical protein
LLVVEQSLEGMQEQGFQLGLLEEDQNLEVGALLEDQLW